MVQAIMIKAKYNGTEYNLSMAMWAEKISIAKSHFRRLKMEGESEGLKDQGLINFILKRRGGRSGAVTVDGCVIRKEDRFLDENSKFWYLFNFGRANLI